MICQWIEKNPDGTYPCLNVIEDTLTLLDTLPVETEHLTDSTLGKQVKKISKDCSSEKIRFKAKDLVNKWYRMIYNLNPRYDAEGAYEDQYRQFRR